MEFYLQIPLWLNRESGAIFDSSLLCRPYAWSVTRAELFEIVSNATSKGTLYVGAQMKLKLWEMGMWKAKHYLCNARLRHWAWYDKYETFVSKYHVFGSFEFWVNIVNKICNVSMSSSHSLLRFNISFKHCSAVGVCELKQDVPSSPLLASHPIHALKGY